MGSGSDSSPHNPCSHAGPFRPSSRAGSIIMHLPEISQIGSFSLAHSPLSAANKKSSFSQYRPCPHAGAGSMPLAELASSSLAQKQPTGDRALIDLVDRAFRRSKIVLHKLYEAAQGIKFPFEFADSLGDDHVILFRDYCGERICATVRHEVDEQEMDTKGRQILLDVSVAKPTGQTLLFGLKANEKDGISIMCMGFESRKGPDEYKKARPNFCDLDANLQKAMHGYLEARGFVPMTITIICDYLHAREVKKSTMFLKGLKSFFSA